MEFVMESPQGFISSYEGPEPSRAQTDQLPGPVVLEFGTPWCAYCLDAQDAIAAAFSGYPHVRHLKVEDGSGRPLGRSYAIKLWPTLVFLRDGVEIARLVRPGDASDIVQKLQLIDAKG